MDLEQIYEDALRVLKLKEWPQVKAKLHDAKVIEALQAYLAGIHARTERPNLYQLYRNLSRRL